VVASAEETLSDVVSAASNTLPAKKDVKTLVDSSVEKASQAANGIYEQAAETVTDVQNSTNVSQIAQDVSKPASALAGDLKDGVNGSQLVNKVSEQASNAVDAVVSGINEHAEDGKAAITADKKGAVKAEKKVAGKAERTVEQAQRQSGASVDKAAAAVKDTAKAASAKVTAVTNGALDALPSVTPATLSQATSTARDKLRETAVSGQAKVSDTASKLPSRSSFAPKLPASLPTPTSNMLPSNRKRKTPKDFQPSGPDDALTPSSPTKMGVKFEDGVAPGEGIDGERIITPKAIKKDRNAAERTIWTFIMIGGFISKYRAGL
jgi:phosphatidate cytidylyltransferase